MANKFVSRIIAQNVLKSLNYHRGKKTISEGRSFRKVKKGFRQRGMRKPQTYGHQKTFVVDKEMNPDQGAGLRRLSKVNP